MFLAKALSNLRPGASWYIEGDEYENVEWRSDASLKPSADEVQQEIDRLQAEFYESQYQRERAPLYPPLTDFADAFYWLQKGDDSKMNDYISKCESIKARFPKRELP